MKRTLTLLLLLCMLLALSACHDYTEDVHEYAMIAESGDLVELDAYPYLEYVDLRGSTCYEEIIQYAQSHPSITVRYNVDLGNERFNQNSTEITLRPSDFQYDVLVENLKYLPELKDLTLSHTELSYEQINELAAAYPNVTIHYDVQFRNQELSSTTTELDISSISSGELEEAMRVISMLPQLKDVYLMDYHGWSSLSIEDVMTLSKAYPSVNFHYDFHLFGQKVSTMDQELILDEADIGNDGVDKIRAALDIMKYCAYVKLDSCGIDDEVMAQLRDDYPDREIVWRIFIDRYSMLTDEEMVRMPTKVTDENSVPLKYCTKVKYIDLYFSKLSDISFVSNMPELECVILTLTTVKDLSPLTNCPNLTWLELVGCGSLKDISPLAQMKNLKYLNISQTGVSDITALENLPLERFRCVKAKVTENDVERFAANHPNCITVIKGSAFGYGWYYNDKDQKEIFDYYKKLEEIFRYNEKGYTGNRKEK